MIKEINNPTLLILYCVLLQTNDFRFTMVSSEVARRIKKDMLPHYEFKNYRLDFLTGNVWNSEWLAYTTPNFEYLSRFNIIPNKETKQCMI